MWKMCFRADGYAVYALTNDCRAGGMMKDKQVRADRAKEMLKLERNNVMQKKQQILNAMTCFSYLYYYYFRFDFRCLLFIENKC